MNESSSHNKIPTQIVRSHYNNITVMSGLQKKMDSESLIFFSTFKNGNRVLRLLGRRNEAGLNMLS